MVLLIVVCIGILVLTFGTIMALTRPSRESRTLVMRLASIRNPRRSLEGEGEDLGITEDQAAGTLSARISEFVKKYPFSAKIDRLILQSQSTQTVGSFVLYSFGTACLLGLIAVFATGSFVMAWPAAGVGILVPFLLLRRKRNKRLNKFAAALPDAVDLLARALRAGHSIQQAIELIAEQSPAPLCDEFEEVHSHQKFGIPFREALLLMTDRVSSKDLSFVVTAILVQKETGGDLIQILERTTEVIRDRSRVEGEIQTYTAQGRLTGWILSGLPVVMLAIISVASPSYPTVLFHDPLGQKLLMAGGVMITIGALLIRKIVAVEI